MPRRAQRSLRRRVAAGHARRRCRGRVRHRALHVARRDRARGTAGENDLPAPIGVAPPITSDPPFHAMARRLLLPAFAPKPIAALEPFTRELCNELLDALEGKDAFDAAVDYAQHIPVGVIVKMLGFPERRRRLLPQGHQDHHRRRRHVAGRARGARRRRRARRVSRRAHRRAHRQSARRPHVVPARRRARRQQAAPRSRAARWCC